MRKPLFVLVVLLALILPVLSLSFAFGSVQIPFSTSFGILSAALLGMPQSDPEPILQIVLNLRLPQSLAAFVVGGGLSIIGVAMQALVRNPLAEPYILGVSSGASAGASLFYLGFIPTLILPWMDITVAAFVGALISITLVYLVAKTGKSISVSRLLLAGVAMAALMGAIASLVTFLSEDLNKMRAVLLWLMGSFHDIIWADLPVAAGITSLGFLVLLAMSRSLDALLIGEEPAKSLGIRVESIKVVLIVISALVTGTLVAISGAIGFVGLIIPHVARSLVGVSHRYVLPASFLMGGLFLVLAETVSRSILPGQQLPVGIVTALAGVPFFLFLLRRTDYQFK